MGENEASLLGLRLRVRPTPLRLAIGVVLFLPLLWAVLVLTVGAATATNAAAALNRSADIVGDVLLPLALAWFGQRFLYEVQTVTIEGSTLVVRRSSWVGPAYAKKVAMDQVRGHFFDVQRLPHDVSNASFRPALKARLVMRGDADTALALLGETLTLDEANEASEVLNRFLQNPSATPAGVDDAPA